MKRKLLSKVLCGTLAAMTLTSGGMMYAGASDTHNEPYAFDFTNGGMEQTSNYRTKEDYTSVYMFCSQMSTTWYFDIYGRWNGGAGSGTDSDTLTVKKINYTFYVSPYFSKDQCADVAIHGMYGWDTVKGQWSPDSL